MLDKAHCQRLAKIEENARNRYANHVSIDHPTQKPNCLLVRVVVSCYGYIQQEFGSDNQSGFACVIQSRVSPTSARVEAKWSAKTIICTTHTYSSQ